MNPKRMVLVTFARCIMVIEMFNFWYFFWIAVSAGLFFGPYFLLRNKSDNVKGAVLFSILAFALLLHFLKAFIPPYSTDTARFYRDIWFVNICGANILLFPFIFLSKSKTAKDYMFYIGVISGFLATFYPTEPIDKGAEGCAVEYLDVIRFYIHHAIIWIVPLLMVVLGLHKLDYRRVIRVGPCLIGLFLFIMLNQLFQQELGFTPVRGFAGEGHSSTVHDITQIGYKNTSYIWGTDPDDAIGKIFDFLCPKLFKTIPVGEYAGQAKHWPFFWLIVPVMVLVTPLAFGISMVFDHKSFRRDMGRVKLKLSDIGSRLKHKK